MAPNRNPNPSQSDSPSPDLKLCGFFLAVVSADPGVPLGSPCSLAAEGDAAAFVLEDGTLLTPLTDGNAVGAPAEGTPVSARKRRRKSTGSVRGSASVVHLVRTLVGSRCLEARGTVVAVSVRIGMGVRAAVAVDVYLPMTLWEGWQFPRCGGLAAALFKHVSCDWEMRSSLDAVIKYQGKSIIDDELIWNTSDCHVLGCKLHSHISHSNAIKLFDLHEVFKSLPCASKDERRCTTRIQPEVVPFSHGIWDITDDILTSVLAALGQRDLVSAASTCRHLRSLASSTIPFLKLKLFPHQEAAVEWMLQRERNSDVLPHPLYMKFSTEDGFSYYINTISGKISTGVAPIVNDFQGGMFCDEPGLGKTVTALSLILKTLGSMADPPHGVEVVWCKHTSVHKCGYYEFAANNVNNHGLMPIMKRFLSQSARRGNMFSAALPSEMVSLGISNTALKSSFESFNIQTEMLGKRPLTNPNSFRTCGQVDGSLSNAKKARRTLGKTSISNVKSKVGRNLKKRKCKSSSPNLNSPADVGHLLTCSSQINTNPVVADLSETWVQCDACKKWRKLSERSPLDPLAAWFCSMNPDHLYQSCTAPEEFWGYRSSITSLPGFYTKGTSPGKDENSSFFWSILKENFTLMDSASMKALTWLAKLTSSKLLEMERNGLSLPIVAMRDSPGQQSREYEKIFQAFGLVRKVIRGTIRWFYPCDLENLTFDSVALQIALTKPLDSFRLYMSRATLVIVPANLVEHWKTQVRKVVSSGHLRVLVWADHKRPSAHNLAWDYDIVITTFSRLSVEWSPRKRSVLMQVHWHRVMLDEGHTLGSSIGLTNKLQMAIALSASNRWILTGTPTPNTPNSQLSHLQPMLKFLHEEAYGMDQESWDAGIFKPFEAELEEGRTRLLALLKRTMISARKKDLKTIPPCIKKVTYLNFNSEHAKSYNELVVTVRRNILMADWNDPSHVESLLNPKQWKFRSNTIRNIRLSCCVAGHIKMLEAGNDIQDTMDILVQHGLDPLSEEYWYIRSSLLNGGSCARCKDWCRLPVITPCRHLLCLQCVALDSERCTFPGCGNFYEMQFPEALTRPENPSPKWPVPKDLIELQPSYRQDNWDPDWQSTSSSKVAYMVKRLKDLLESNNDLAACQNEFDNQMAFPTYSEGCFSTQGSVSKSLSEKTSVKLDKVIIFSQFLEHIHVIEQQLTVAGIKYAGMYSPMPTSSKMKSLMTFQHDVECLALLMDGSAALGLDLSFVSHVFLMEPIWDRSIEEQVISRAHRMGATCPINVETLAMRGTIEEQMLEFLQDADLCRTLKQDTCSADYEGQRAHRTLHDFAESNYLAHLMFVRTNLDC